MTRQRIEDLGRIAEKLDALFEWPVFNEPRHKHSPQPWDAEKVAEFMMGFERLRNELYDIYEIARHGDETE
jgi:hypothetical protein